MSLARYYLHLPGWAQPTAIRLYGWYLKRLRTGPVYRRAIEEFAQRDRYTAEQWRHWQTNALRSQLRHAVEHVPYYRELHKAGRYPVEEVHSLEDLARLPSICKWHLYERPKAFLADNIDRRTLIPEGTSGTTGTPLKLWYEKTTLKKWYAAVEQRMRRWNGLHDGMRHATLGGRAVVPADQRKPPYWRYNPFARQLYMSLYHISPETCDHYLDALRNYRVEYIYGYSSALHALAQHALKTGRDDVRVRAVISNAEPFFEPWRERVEKAFQCRTVDTYSASEQTFACYEFERTFYVSPDIGVLEIVRDDDSQACPDELGEVCATGLLDRGFVLIRYRQGDRAALAGPEVRGPGPIEMPILKRLDGRTDDVLVTPDGRVVGRLDPVFKGGLFIREAQLALLARDLLEARLVVEPGFDAAIHGEQLMRRMRQRLGPSMRLRVRKVAEIPRGPNGKFRFFVREHQKSVIGDATMMQAPAVMQRQHREP